MSTCIHSSHTYSFLSTWGAVLALKKCICIPVIIGNAPACHDVSFLSTISQTCDLHGIFEPQLKIYSCTYCNYNERLTQWASFSCEDGEPTAMMSLPRVLWPGDKPLTTVQKLLGNVTKFTFTSTSTGAHHPIWKVPYWFSQ